MRKERERMDYIAHFAFLLLLLLFINVLFLYYQKLNGFASNYIKKNVLSEQSLKIVTLK